MKYFFFKVLRFTICFLFFLLFFTLHFQFCLCVLVKKFYKFLGFFILWLRDFIKECWKIMEYFSKNYSHSKSKILHKFHRLLFVFFFSILVIFFPISPIQTSQKILNIFVVLYCTDYRFYQRILENS